MRATYNGEMKKSCYIVGLIPMYKPNQTELRNIESYVDTLDYCFLLDDSGFSNEKICSHITSGRSNVEYIMNEKNIGLCASVNNGFQLAFAKGADWILIMNPDGTFKNDIIDIYKKYINDYDTSLVAIIAPRYSTDRRKKKSGKGFKEINYADMSGSLYNAEILKRLGLYDLKTYFYGLDAEYCLRLKKNGYRIIECSQAVLNHHPGETFKITFFGKTIFKCGKDSPVRYYYQFRSYYYFNRKYHSLFHMLWISYKKLKVIFFFDKKKEYYKMIKKAKIDCKRGYFGALEE